jgi:uncharacterized protein (TIGR03000 family)
VFFHHKEHAMSRSLSRMSAGIAGLIALATLALTAGRVVAEGEKKPAFLSVKVPADARLEIEGVSTKQTGETRRFQSPDLVVGKKYSYTLKATFTRNGKPVSVEKTVSIVAGEETTVDLREPTATPTPTPPKKEPEPKKEPKPEPKPEPKKATPKDEAKKPARSPDVVYVPTPQEVVDKMLELAEVKKGDVVYDLGCGDGRIVVTAAKKYGVKAIGFDIDPERIKESNDNVKKAKVEDKVTIKQEDIFGLDLNEPTVITLYLLPELNKKLMPKLKKMKPGSRIVSHDFRMGNDNAWVPDKEAKVTDADGTTHEIFLWRIGDASKGDAPKKEEKKEEKKKDDKPKTGATKEAPKEVATENKHPDVIYVPTPQEVVDKMLEVAEVKKGDVVYDLGCGDGRIVVTAAKKFGVKAIGFDIDPERIKDSNDNVAKAKVGDLVTIKKEDIFKQDLTGASVITLYLLPDLNVKLMPQLEKMKPGSRIVSHDFDMRGAKPKKVIKVTPKGDTSREHTIYLWTIPLEKVSE